MNPNQAQKRTNHDGKKKNIVRKGRGKEEKVVTMLRLPTCPHVEITNPVPNGGFDVNGACKTCEPQSTGEKYYVCLYCYEVHCGRVGNGKKHFKSHFAQTKHPIALDLTTLAPTCLDCDEKLLADAHENIENAVTAAVRGKFGMIAPLPSLEK